MKDTLVLLILLSSQTIKVWSEPYQPQIQGQCLNPDKEFLNDDLCCKKCPPGFRLKQLCTETTDTECEPCPRGQHQQGWNYNTKCFRCRQCKSAKGLQYVVNCSAAENSRCECKPGMYCIMDADTPSCSECMNYRRCGVGNGVSKPGDKKSDVTCERCPDGTFSDTVSHTDRCRPHTDCQGRPVLKQGNAESDTICEPGTTSKDPHIEIVLTTVSTVVRAVFATTDSEAPPEPTDSTSTISPSVSEAVFNRSTKSQPPNTESDSTLAVTIIIVMAAIFLLVITLLLLLKQPWKKDARKFHPKVDANENDINLCYSEESQPPLTATSLEHQHLLEKGEPFSDQSQCSTNTETSTRDGCSSFESIGPLQSTALQPNSPSALSEPMPLLSNTEPVPARPSFSTQSSQPTSPQIISPVTTSPHVNVNITFHIGNGSGGTPSVIPTDYIQADSLLPFGEKDESFSTPQQENGKQSLMSVQESESFSALTDTTMTDTSIDTVLKTI